MVDLYWLFQVEMAESGRDRDADYDMEWEFEKWLLLRATEGGVA